MTSRELIELLQSMPPEAVVYRWRGEGEEIERVTLQRIEIGRYEVIIG